MTSCRSRITIRYLAAGALLLLMPPAFCVPAFCVEDAFTTLLHRGFALHQQADYTHALPLLRQAWKLNPHDYFVNLLMGMDLLRTSEPRQAISFLTAASRTRPKEDFPYEYLGEAQTQLRRYDQAASAYMKAIAVAPDGREAMEAWVDFALERFRQLAGELRSSQPGLAAEYRLQARSYPGHEKQKRDLLRQSAELDPDAPGIWAELATADRLAGDEAGLRQDAHASSHSDPIPPGGGIALAQSGQCTPAIPLLERDLGAGSGAVYQRFLLSWCYAQAAGAVDARLQKSEGDLALAHLIRGNVLFRLQGNPPAAIAEYQAALALRSHDPKLLEKLAEAQLAAGDLEAAEQNARSALALDAHRHSAMQTVARVAMEQQRYAEALPQLNLLAAQDPQDAGIQISLATALGHLGKPQEALQHLEPALASGYPDEKGNLHSLLGGLLRKVGRTTQASQAFATARQLSENYQLSAHPDQEKDPNDPRHPSQ